MGPRSGGGGGGPHGASSLATSVTLSIRSAPSPVCTAEEKKRAAPSPAPPSLVQSFDRGQKGDWIESLTP
jgi:hypothetical protein